MENFEIHKKSDSRHDSTVSTRLFNRPEIPFTKGLTFLLYLKFLKQNPPDSNNVQKETIFYSHFLDDQNHIRK